MTENVAVPEDAVTWTFPAGCGEPPSAACETTPTMRADDTRIATSTLGTADAPVLTVPCPSMVTETTWDSRSARENVTVYVLGSGSPLMRHPPAGALLCVTVCRVTAPSLTVTVIPAGLTPVGVETSPESAPEDCPRVTTTPLSCWASLRLTLSVAGA